MSERTTGNLLKKPTPSNDPLNPAEREDPLRNAAIDRIAIEGVQPEIDGGRFAVKRAVGDVMTVEADVFCDGHDKIDAALHLPSRG